MSNTVFNSITRTAMAETTLTVDFAKHTGKAINPLHGMNSGPRNCASVYDARPQFVEAGIPFVRLHDVEYPYGSGEYVDVPCIFKCFDADENDPKNYNFAQTDEYIRQCTSVGARIIYRLGVSIEHNPTKLHTYPPKDFAKWARICEHIIRHYTEGWADGHHWDIQYWEIWNESDAESTKTWAGTQKQFIDFYTVAATHLKACFPHLKIGGCGFTGSHVDNVISFLQAISAQTPAVPLDFFSFHCYSATPKRPLELWQRFRTALNELGYTDTEMLLDEWNYMGSWDSLNQPIAYHAMKDFRGASYYAAMLCAMQSKTDIFTASYFEATPVKEFCGIFNVGEMRVSIKNSATVVPTKGFYAFKYFNSLYRMGNEVTVDCNDDAIQVTAATGVIGNGLMVVNQGIEPVMLKLSLQNAATDVVIRLTDPVRTDSVIKTIPCENAHAVSLNLPAQSFAYIGTDLPDPVPTFDPHCYDNVSVAPPVDDIFD